MKTISDENFNTKRASAQEILKPKFVIPKEEVGLGKIKIPLPSDSQGIYRLKF